MRVSLAPRHLRDAPPGGLAARAAANLLDPRGPRVVLGGSDGVDGLAQPIQAAAGTLFGPRGACLAGRDGPLFVCDTGHHRLMIWSRAPQSDHAPADLLIGQPTFSREGRNAKGDVGAATLNVPTGLCAAAGVLAVADAWNHRVLLWHGLPTRSNQPADVVLGQSDFGGALANRGNATAGADTLNWCYGVAIFDGRLVVADTGNRRVLVWDGIPEANGAPADLVIGQRDLTTRNENAGEGAGPLGMRWPHGVAYVDGLLLVSDAGNNRVMAWYGWPMANGVPCDFVLGQTSPYGLDHNRAAYYPTAGAMNMPYGLTTAGDRLVVADTANSRLLGFDLDTLAMGTGASHLAAQHAFTDKGDNRWGPAARDSLCWPYSASACGETLAIADSGNNRVLLWEGRAMTHERLHETRAEAQVASGVAREIRVRGRVQGVGFRPTVWRLARELGLVGEIFNDADGVLIRVGGDNDSVGTFILRLEREPPPLGRIDRIEIRDFEGDLPPEFRIADSRPGHARTQVSPDAAICPACAAEIVDPFARRFRYPFSTCTHCGPRLTIVTGIPYDRAATTMAGFPLCAACDGEYRDPADRRFHAEAMACHACGPQATLIRLDGRATSFDQHSMLDDVDAIGSLIQKGEIVAIKGLGGYQLACDATKPELVERLRRLKCREAKPFALMARDLDVIRSYCEVGDDEDRLLASPEAPIVLLDATGPKALPEAVAPGIRTLGFMLPTTPLHALILRRNGRPVVMTSGNLSDEPQVVDDERARETLAGIATYALVHDRPIANRVDDSVVRRVLGRTRVMRRARGYAPAPIALPQGFETAAQLLAMGGELKTTFALVKDGTAILSQHLGDLEDAATFEDYRRTLALYADVFDHKPVALVADRHPEYLSTKLARDHAEAEHLPLIEVQHHHAHVAACLAETGRPLAAPPVLGIVLDGLGMGDDGTLWGGEFLLADYRCYERLGTFKPVAMPGGAQAAREPWRNLYAHLVAEMGWAGFAMNFADLDVYADLEARPRAMLDAMMRNGLNAPKASSCGRLFDAVAAALGICRDRQAYEGEAAMRLEALVDPATMRDDDDTLAYPFAIPNLRGSGLPYIEPLAMWQAILGDLILATPPPIIAARFHKGLAKTIATMATKLAGRDTDDAARFDTIALSGGCFQNRVLFEDVVRRLEREGFTLLSHAQVPANDGGLALGQAAIGAAHLLDAPP